MPENITPASTTARPSDPLEVRLVALNILNAAQRTNQTLDAVLERFRRQFPLPSQRDRALLQKIVFGVLRWRGRLDHIIGSFSHTPLMKIQPEILNILRIGTFQVVYLDRIPVSAAVNTSVEIAKTLAPSWVVRFINAVLRKVVNGHHQVRYPSISKEPIAALAVRKSFPPWLIQRWLKRFSLKETTELCDAINTIPPITLRANTLKIDRPSLLQMMAQHCESATAAPQSPDGIHLHHPRMPLPDLDAYRMGLFQVQDEAAQLVSLLLNPKPGERVLDACAGRGGKTGHIAQLMNNRGEIAAVDVIAEKLKELTAEMQRVGFTIVTTHRIDLLRNMHDFVPGTFDRILLDAPCSGLGVIRRNPDSKWKGEKETLDRYSGRQIALLDSIVPLVKHGGILLYSVCSNEPEECEAVVDHFLERHEDFRLASPPPVNPGEDTYSFGHDGMLKTFPHRHNMDGFFAARFRRI